MTELSLFTGAGGGVWASKLLGHRIVGYVEREEYCKKVIRQRIRDGYFDDAPIFDDVRAFDGRPYRGRVDIVSAGFPCQPFSTAGKRRGAADERNMWPDTIRIIREVRPRYCFLENVPGLLAESHGYFGTVLQDLAESGFDAEWTVLGASDLGAPHRRKRLWILAHSERQRSGSRRNDGEAGSKDAIGPNTERLCEIGNVADSRRINGGSRLSAPRSNQPKENIHDQRCGEGSVGWWSVEPDVGRVANGVAHRRDRLRALGNGQVPIVAATAFRLLMEQR